MSSAVMVAVLVLGGTWLALQRDLLRVALGFVLLSHAVNLVLLAAGGTDRRGPAIIGDTPPGQAADPLPQAFVLTAIVITFGITVLLAALAGSRDGTAESPAADDDRHRPADRPHEPSEPP